MRAAIARLRILVTELPPEQAIPLLTVGLVLGVFPVMGLPTLFCLLIGFRLRLNLVALQLVNQICSPLQLALLVPFERVGSVVCGKLPLATTASGMVLTVVIHAVAGWAILCVPAGVLAYVASRRMFCSISGIS